MSIFENFEMYLNFRRFFIFFINNITKMAQNLTDRQVTVETLYKGGRTPLEIVRVLNGIVPKSTIHDIIARIKKTGTAARKLRMKTKMTED